MLTLNHNQIPIPLNFSIRMEWMNPVCFFDKIPGSAGLGINIPVNEYSRAFFGNPQLYSRHSTLSVRKFPNFSIHKNGMLFETGTLVINSATEDSYSAWLQSALGVIGEQERDKVIGESEWDSDQVFASKAEYDPLSDKYCTVRIRNDHFFEGKGASGNFFETFLDEDAVEKKHFVFKNYLQTEFVNNANGEINSTLPVEDEPNVVIPTMFFSYLLKKVLHLKGFAIRNPLDADSTLSNLAVYNNFSIFAPTIKNTISVAKDSYNHRRSTYTSITKNQISSIGWEMLPFSYADLVPKISLKDFLLSIQNTFNIAFHFKSDNTVTIVNRQDVLKSDAFDLDAYLIGEWEMGERQDVSLKFVTEYDKDDANFADEFHDLSDRWQDFKEPVATFADLALITHRSTGTDFTIGQLRYVEDENNIYEFRWTVHHNTEENGIQEQMDVLGWELKSSGPQYYVYRHGDTYEEIKTSLSTLCMENGVLNVKQQGNFQTMRNSWADFSFRMFFYHNGTVGSDTSSDGNVSMKWEGDSGLFANYWKLWSPFWTTRQPVVAKFNLPLNVLHYVKENITGKFRTRHGDFIIESMSADIGIDKVSLVTIKGFKL